MRLSRRREEAGGWLGDDFVAPAVDDGGGWRRPVEMGMEMRARHWNVFC